MFVRRMVKQKKLKRDVLETGMPNRDPPRSKTHTFGEIELIENHMINNMKTILSTAACLPWDGGFAVFFSL